MHTPTRLAITLCALAVAGCAGNGPDVGTPSTDWFSRLQREIFDVNCLSAGCHNPQSQAGGLVLAAGFSYDSLVVNSEPNNAAARAAGLQRVTPFNTSMSFLFIKLTNPGPGEGERMPSGNAPLSPADLDIVSNWILAGAPPAQTPTAGGGATGTPTTTETATTAATATATATVAATTVPPSPAATPAASVTPTGSLQPTPTTSAPATPSPSPTATHVVTLAEVQAQVFTPHCLDLGCHTSTAQAGSMVLEDGSSFASTVNVPAVNFAAMNGGLLRVNPGNPDTSFLLIKLTGPTLPQGSQMPMGKPKLSDDLIALVRTWIAQGANP